jgi:4-hydroxy-2-oxoheptanedioate aldolase
LAQQPKGGHLNRLIEIFNSGKSASGALLRGEGLDYIEQFLTTDLDFVIFDLEHRPTDYQAVRVMMQGLLDRADIAQRGSLQPKIVPIIRIPADAAERTRFLTKHALDLGTYGIVAPHIDTPEEMQAAVAAARYPRPDDDQRGLLPGVRGVGPQVAMRYWGLSRSDYFQRAEVWPLTPDAELMVIPMIESRAGVNNIEKILAVKGVSAVFLGPGDMSVAFGHTSAPPGGGLFPDVEAAFQRVINACKSAKIPCGTVSDAKGAPERLRQGFRFLVGDNATAQQVKAWNAQR